MHRDDLFHRLAELKPWLAERGMQRLRVFGSQARGDATENSDLDLLIEFHPERTPGLLAFVALRHRLEDLLRMRIDLVTPAALSPNVLERVLAEAVDA